MSDVTFSALPSPFGGGAFPYDDSSSVGTMSSAPSPNYSEGSSDCVYLQHNFAKVALFSDQSYRPFGLPPMNEPHLVIREQPVEKFRFRYKSEMLGTHGSILGRNSDKSRKKTFPTVELCGYKHPAIIRCSLYTAGVEESSRTLHAHRLIVRAGNEDKDDPHDFEVSPDNGFVAVFQGMGIIHTARKNITDELVKRKRVRLLEQYRCRGDSAKFLSTKDELQIKIEAEAEGKKMSLNTVCLCFEAFRREPGGLLQPICKPVFSQPINNMKSALTGELKICRIDKCVSSCLGGEEIFILVEKVGKKNIKIKFFELDDEDNEIWYDFAKFSELDVHHQYAIVFRTPPYRHMDIEDKVEVYLQLYRPTDGECSEPIRFHYNPAEKLGRKRQRTSVTEDNMLFMQQKMSSYLQQQQQQQQQRLDSGGPAVRSLDDTQALLNNMLNDAENGMNSAEFKDFFMNLSDEYLKLCSEDLTADCATQAIGVFHSDRDPRPSSTIEQKAPKGSSGMAASNIIKMEQIDVELLARQTVVDLENLMLTKPPPNKVAEMVDKIFEHKSDDGNSALQTAIMFHQDDLLKQMLVRLTRGHHSAIIDSKNHKGETALHVAVHVGREGAVRELMRAGADPNLRDDEGSTPLHLAVLKDDNAGLLLLEALLSTHDYLPATKKPDCTIKNNQGCTALHVAVRQRSLYAVEKLVSFGADVNELDANSRTALHLAVEEQDLAIAEFLLKKTNISVNSYNLCGHTALHVACANDNVEMVKLLLDAEADPHLKMCKGKSKDETTEKGAEVKVKVEPEDDADVEEEEDEEEEDDDDEEEEEDEERGENSSFDLASKKILQLFKDTLKPSSDSGPVNEDGCMMMTCPEEAAENRLFDADTLERLCEVLDASGGWVNLADLLDYGFLLPNIRNSASPSKLLFNYADIHGNVSVQEIRAFLEALDEDEAIAVLDAMLERREAILAPADADDAAAAAK